jgi:hypothetical protein
MRRDYTSKSNIIYNKSRVFLLKFSFNVDDVGFVYSVVFADGILYRKLSILLFSSRGSVH